MVGPVLDGGDYDRPTGVPRAAMDAGIAGTTPGGSPADTRSR